MNGTGMASVKMVQSVWRHQENGICLRREPVMVLFMECASSYMVNV